MGERIFDVTLDGCMVRIDSTAQRVTVFDENGTATFCDSIQVAAGSLQGLFSAVDVLQPGKMA